MLTYGSRNWVVHSVKAYEYLQTLRERMWNFDWYAYPHAYGETIDKIENFIPNGLVQRWVSAKPVESIPFYMRNCFSCSAPSSDIAVPYCKECFYSKWQGISSAQFMKQLEIFRQVYDFCTAQIDIIIPLENKLRTWADLEQEL